MTSLTDPARELAELCDRLQTQSANRGDEFLAKAFDVPAWSQEFYQIIFCIIERADFLINLVDELELDHDFKTQAVSHIQAIKQAFGQHGVMNQWKTHGLQSLSAVNVQPVKMLSPMIRQKVSYPKLSDEELAAVLGEVEELADWLSEHQTKEHDFIRQAILDGLEQFSFRLERVGWLGWGYTLESLREVIGAYLALERGLPEDGIDPVAEAALKKISAFVKSFYEKTQLFKGAVESGDFMLRAYGAASIVAQGGSIAGLLTSGS